MAFIKPAITGLTPGNTVHIIFTGGSAIGLSAPYSATINVSLPPGVLPPATGKAILSILNTNQYTFENGATDIEANFTMNLVRDTITIPFRIRNVSILATKPVPLILSACTYDVKDGPDFKLCHNGSFPVTSSTTAFRIKSFK